jgi:hypothetical protein
MKLLPRFLKFLYYFTILGAFCANMIVVSQTTTLSVLGAGLALRGPDGSMMTATDGLYEERASVFLAFGIGLACTVGSVLILVWIILDWEAALFCMLLTLYTARTIWKNYRRVQQKFDYDESQTVDFRDIFEGPAAIQAVPWNGGKWNNRSKPNNKFKTSPSKFDHSKKSNSMPVEIDDGTSDDDNWGGHPSSHASSQRLLRRQAESVKHRRGRSGSPSEDHTQQIIIQTI